MTPVKFKQASENHQVRQDSLVQLFSNHGSPKLYQFNQVGGNRGRGRFKKHASVLANYLNRGTTSLNDPNVIGSCAF